MAFLSKNRRKSSGIVLLTAALTTLYTYQMHSSYFNPSDWFRMTNPNETPAQRAPTPAPSAASQTPSDSTPAVTPSYYSRMRSGTWRPRQETLEVSETAAAPAASTSVPAPNQASTPAATAASSSWVSGLGSSLYDFGSRTATAAYSTLPTKGQVAGATVGLGLSAYGSYLARLAWNIKKAQERYDSIIPLFLNDENELVQPTSDTAVIGAIHEINVARYDQPVDFPCVTFIKDLNRSINSLIPGSWISVGTPIRGAALKLRKTLEFIRRYVVGLECYHKQAAGSIDLTKKQKADQDEIAQLKKRISELEAEITHLRAFLPKGTR